MVKNQVTTVLARGMRLQHISGLVKIEDCRYKAPEIAALPMLTYKVLQILCVLSCLNLKVCRLPGRISTR